MEENFNIKKADKKQSVKKGTVIISAGTEGNAILVLNRGKVVIEHPMSELLESYIKDNTSSPKRENFETEMPIGYVGENQYFGWETFIPRSASFPVLRCMEESEISIYPCDGIDTLIQKSPLAFTAIIRAMNHNLNYFVSYNNKIVALANQIVEANFKLAILFKKLNLTFSNKILSEYLALGQPNYDFLQMSKFINAVPDFKSKAHRFNLRDTTLLDSLYELELRDNVVQILTKQPKIGRFSFETILREFTYIYKFIGQNLDLLIKEFSVLTYDEVSFLKQLVLQKDKINFNKWHGLISLAWEYYNERFFSNFFIKRIFDIDKLAREVVIERESIETSTTLMVEENMQSEDFADILTGEDHATQTGKLAVTSEEAAKKAEEQQRRTKAAEVIAAMPDSEMNLTAFMGSEEPFLYKRPSLSEDLITVVMKKSKEIESDLSQFKKSVRMLNSVYLKALERAAAMLYIAKKEDKDARQLLRHGILNAKFLSSDQLGILMNFEDTGESPYDIISLEKWLERIAMGEEEPSNDQLGFSFEKFMAGKIRFLSEKAKRKLDEQSDEEKQLGRLSFEINNMIATAYKISNFSVSGTIVYMMNRTNLPENLTNVTLVTRQMITDFLNEMLGYDHLLFFRESLFQVSETKNYIIEVEVLPKFIIIPSVGSKVVFWQEIVGTKKKTPGRFVVPLVFLGDFRKTMIHALASFRWELNRTVKGVSWMSPVEGGLTGYFIDYLMFYKKRSSLSFEAKEKIAKFIKNNRNNARNMFASLYYEWIEFERKGLVRLNVEERKIMFLFVPFAKKIRESLSKFPLYRDLIRIHDLRMDREVDRFSKHYSHLKDEEGKFPDEVENYITSRQR
ncbi:hypothetical protein COTS27_00831 [Spirochaetota bacterium]|nr:hypothetical protein COTS27_00831 [Spirochaetota bacterium]